MPRSARPRAATILVLAKEPVPGRVKTRLCPPCSPEQAAAVAAAALHDTLLAADSVGAADVVLALDGESGPWVPRSVEVIPQRGNGFAERLTNAWFDVGGPIVQIGMDTPQVTPDHLDAAIALLAQPGTGSVLGPALDGGWWLLGMRSPHPAAFTGIAMSEPDTGARQLARLRALGRPARLLHPLRDIDTFDDARAVADALPGSATARAVALVASTERAEAASHG